MGWTSATPVTTSHCEEDRCKIEHFCGPHLLPHATSHRAIIQVQEHAKSISLVTWLFQDFAVLQHNSVRCSEEEVSDQRRLFMYWTEAAVPAMTKSGASSESSALSQRRCQNAIEGMTFCRSLTANRLYTSRPWTEQNYFSRCTFSVGRAYAPPTYFSSGGSNWVFIRSVFSILRLRQVFLKGRGNDLGHQTLRRGWETAILSFKADATMQAFMLTTDSSSCALRGLALASTTRFPARAYNSA